MPQVRVVLVRAETSANIGATARVLRNTGLRSLCLVAPGDWRTVECWRTAWGAHEVLEQALVFPDLAAALSGCEWVVAFSGRRERGAAILDVREAAAQLACLDDAAPAALVFGPEGSGLSADELALCGRRALIPAHPAQPSLNLSHAVMVAAYEVLRARRRPRQLRLASHEAKQGLLALLREGLLAVRALPARHSDGAFRDWQALVQRLDLTPHELGLLEHMARNMLKNGRGRGPRLDPAAGGRALR